MAAKNIDKDVLYELYYVQKKTAKEICKILNVAQLKKEGDLNEQS